MTHPEQTITRGHRTFHAFTDIDSLDQYALELWRDAYETALRTHGRFFAALSGGNTPAGLYRRIADDPRPVDWNNVHLFLVDERFVPPGHDESNARMIRETLVSRIPLNEDNFHTIPTETATPEIVAAVYEDHLKTFFAMHGTQSPAFDLMLLGIGEDGHTASLFPESPSLNERTAFTAATSSPVSPAERITLTFPVINNSEHIIFIAAGANKRHVLEHIASSDKPEFPAEFVQPRHGNVLFLLDISAGTFLY